MDAAARVLRHCGRMALTNYVLQCVVIFLLVTLCVRPPPESVLLRVSAVLLFSATVLLSRAWLLRFLRASSGCGDRRRIGEFHRSGGRPGHAVDSTVMRTFRNCLTPVIIGALSITATAQSATDIAARYRDANAPRIVREFAEMLSSESRS